MIRINLLPHREEKRKQKIAAFNAMLVLGAVFGVAIALGIMGYMAGKISVQEQRNRVLREGNAELDKKIATIATLKQEIEGLKARQQAVEDLQGDRNEPVYLLDELVKQTPDGVFYKSFRQEAQRVTLTGNAQSQERVAELLRNLSDAEWLERPELEEVKAVAIPAGTKQTRKVVEFSLKVDVRRPRDKAAAAAAAGTPAAGTPAAAPAPGAVAAPATTPAAPR